MIFLSFFFGGNNNEVDVVDTVLAKIRNVEHVVRSNWTSWWDRIYMQEVKRNDGEHPTMEVFKSTANGSEVAVIRNEDDTFTVICRLGFDHADMSLEEALTRIQEFVDAEKTAEQKAA